MFETTLFCWGKNSLNIKPVYDINVQINLEIVLAQVDQKLRRTFKIHLTAVNNIDVKSTVL